MFNIDAEREHASFYPATVSHDGKTLAAIECTSSPRQSRLLTMNVENFAVKSIDFPQGTLVTDIAFNPDDSLVAAMTIQFLKEMDLERDLCQRICHNHEFISWTCRGRKIVETRVGPQCYMNSAAFSPDGKTLATSGPGEVQLWDVRKSPVIPL